MEWTMVYLFVALKVPLLAACWLIWWAINAEPEPVDEPGDDGGNKHRPRPREPRPRDPRRGPRHAGPAPVAPARTRTPTPARARTHSR